MIKVTMLIPAYDNDGNGIDANALGRCFSDILMLCGGYTRGPINLVGAWNDSSGQPVFDKLYRLEVCCDEYELNDLRDIASQIATICKQQCLYFEHHPVTLEFLKPC